MRRLRFVTAVALVAWAVCGARAHSQPPVAEPPEAATAAPLERSSVLVLIPVQPGRPIFDLLSRGIAAEFLRGAAPPVALFVEHLFDMTAPPEVAAREFDLVKAKYAGQRIDAIIAIAHPRYLTVREDLGLSARVPLIFLAERASREVRPPNSVFVDVTATLLDSYRFLRPLFPASHDVALIGGAAAADRTANDETLVALRALLGADRVHDLTTLSLGEMRRRVDTLRPGTVLLVGSALTDRDGRRITLPILLSAVVPGHDRPIVVHNDVLLGQGVLGGALYRVEDVGARAAATTLRVLRGTAADSIGTVRLPAEYLIDARQLQQLGLPESRVPSAAQLLWREPPMWQAYRGWLIGGLSLLVLQSLLIAGLLAERRRRRESQRQLADRLRLQAVVAEISTEFANLPGDRLDAQILASLRRVGEALQIEECAILTLGPADGASRLVSRWPEGMHAPSSTSLLEEALLTWARPRLEQRQEVQVRDVARHVGALEHGDASHMDSMLFLPLSVDERVIGILALRHAFSQEWSAHVLGDLRTIGEIVATAVVRKRTDASMRQQLETLAHLNRVASLGELAASLAHELNQPLAAILSNAEVAQQLLAMSNPPVDELRDILSDVIADDERAGEIIRNMRTMLRRHQVEVEALDVNAVATEITRLLAHDVRLRSGTLAVSLGEHLPDVAMDATQLKQVLLNLVVNGVDAMASLHVRQPVELRTSAHDGGVLIEVRDQGPGIPSDILPRLFDPFFTTKPNGLGVGLAITRSIVDAAGGRIAAANAPGGGAVFSVWLPAAVARQHVTAAGMGAVGARG